MSRNQNVRRIFGGALAGPNAYTRPLLNETDQAVAETLAVGTTRRVFKGPVGDGAHWSYHISVVSAAGATSALTFKYSNLPNPDPTNADHWVDSGISPIDLNAAADSFATLGTKSPEWIMAEAVVANSTGTVWGYVRVGGVDE